MKIIRTCFLFCLFYLVGCSTILNNKSQSIRINTTNNQTASAEINQSDTSPYNITVPNVIQTRPSSFQPLIIKVNDPCFISNVSTVDKSIGLTYWANVFTYFIGFPIDYMTGYMWQYDDTVNLVLAANENTSQECQIKQMAVAQIDNTSMIKPRFRPHRFSAGFLTNIPSQRRNTEATNDVGLYIEYAYRLNSEMMTNFKYHYTSADNTYNYLCSSKIQSCYTSINTNQTALSFSLRHYLHPESNLYAGLGAAQIFVEQTASESYSTSGINRIEAHTNTIFLDFGWQARSSKPSLYINGVIDLADLHLSSPDLSYSKKRAEAYRDSFTQTKAEGLLKHASIISNVSLGILLTF